MAERPELSDELIDELLGGVQTAEQIAGPDGLLGQLTRRLLERALAAELTDHLGYAPGQAPPGGAGNARNGQPAKTVITEHGTTRVRSPRDRKGTFEPQIVKKGQSRFVGFDDKVIGLYARGMTVREIGGHLAEIYGTEVSPDLISTVTDAVLEDVKAWQTRPLEAVYPIVYLDCLMVKIRDGQAVRNHACYLAIGVNCDGERDVLGIWFQRTEGAKFWMSVLTDLKQRGVQDVLVCCVDGLTGFPEAIEAVFPQTWVQTCLVHQVRSSLRFVPYKDKRAVAADLKRIYTAANADAAADELAAFAEKWDARFPTISRSWLAHWEQITPFLAFPPNVRRVVYTTNTIEALNRQIRKIIKTRGHFPTEDAARKLIWLAITRAQTKWRRAYNWNAALAAFKIHFGDRIPDTI
ncbi:MAG: IS256 family transposase [Actinomycetota bacterium]|nr:IS256 family transposase [Actinomycetota bacterium]